MVSPTQSYPGVPGGGSIGNGNGEQSVPKAILYSWKTSVWATVPLLCLHEKGYSEEEYDLREVDITKGENFSPAYLRINADGTVPTLVVPIKDTTGPDVASRYRSLRDTMTIAGFLDQARSIHTTSTVSSLPAPSLSPATIEGKALSDQVTSLVHLPTVDPNFLFLSARNPEELAAKRSSSAGDFVADRRVALQGYVADAEQKANEKAQNAPGADSFEQRTVQFLREKLAANHMLGEIYDGSAGADREAGFFEASRKAWTESLPDVLTKLDELIQGPYTLGDHISLADLHIISWLARTIEICGGQANSSGILAVDKEIGGGYKVGKKLSQFCNAWYKRESFKKVYPDGFSLQTTI